MSKGRPRPVQIRAQGTPLVAFSVFALDDLVKVAKQMRMKEDVVHSRVAKAVAKHTESRHKRHVFFNRWNTSVEGICAEYDLMTPRQAMVVALSTRPWYVIED